MFDCIQFVDVLVDGRFEIDKLDKNAHWVGSTNQRVIDVKRSLKEGAVVEFKSN
jgi:anaerobic ribonucleoside-triphosphate reductase activating protein